MHPLHARQSLRVTLTGPAPPPAPSVGGAKRNAGGSVEGGDATPRLWRRTSPPWVRRGIERGMRADGQTRVEDGGGHPRPRAAARTETRGAGSRTTRGRDRRGTARGTGRTSGTSRSFAPRSSLSPASRMGGEGRRRGQIRAGRGARDEMKKAGPLGGGRTHPDAPLRATTQACDGAMKSSRSPSFTAPENPAIAWTRPRRRVCAARREFYLIPVPVPVPVPRGRPSASPTRARKSFSPQFWLTGVSREPTRARVASRRYRDDGVDAIARRMYSYLRST